jgi:hypothetical protein
MTSVDADLSLDIDLSLSYIIGLYIGFGFFWYKRVGIHINNSSKTSEWISMKQWDSLKSSALSVQLYIHMSKDNHLNLYNHQILAMKWKLCWGSEDQSLFFKKVYVFLQLYHYGQIYFE